METQEFDTLRRQLSETADQLIEQFDQYNPITNVQKELKAKAESMISDISFTLDPTTFKFDFISEKFNEIWDTDSFKDKKKALIDLAQAGELTPETLKSYEEFNDLLETGYVTLKDITSHIQSQYPIEEIIDPNAPKSVKDLTEQLGSLSSTGDLVTKALQEISETGGVSTSTFSAWQSALPGVENAFERTANGIQFNTEKLRELTAAQTQTMADDLAKKYSALSKEYTEQSTLLAAYIYRQHENSDMTETQRSTLESLSSLHNGCILMRPPNSLTNWKCSVQPLTMQPRSSQSSRKPWHLRILAQIMTTSLHLWSRFRKRLRIMT